MNNLPAMTEEQRQELIRHNRAKLNAITPQFLKESTPGVKKHLQSEIDSSKIAIAALTAEPEYHTMVGNYYTAPPAPVLRVPDEKHYKESPHGESSLWAMGWNECLAEVKRLNTQPSPPETSNAQ